MNDTASLIASGERFLKSLCPSRVEPLRRQPSGIIVFCNGGNNKTNSECPDTHLCIALHGGRTSNQMGFCCLKMEEHAETEGMIAVSFTDIDLFIGDI